MKIAFVVAFALAPSFALSQHQPYAGFDQRPIKALSQQQIADLRAGRGMGLALPAELNGYPGPSHVLEHADALRLTAEQREKTRALFEAMKAEAVPIGERLIEQEARLDGLFANQRITPASLSAATQEIGLTQARLREAHLKYHLAMLDLLTRDQVEAYRTLRGYGPNGSEQHRHRR